MLSAGDNLLVEIMSALLEMKTSKIVSMTGNFYFATYVKLLPVTWHNKLSYDVRATAHILTYNAIVWEKLMRLPTARHIS